MTSIKTYEIELLKSLALGAKNTMWRNGREFEHKMPVILELTDDEVKVFENDPRFKITVTKNSRSKNAGGDVGESESVSSAADVADSEETAESEIETSETQDVESEEETGDEDAEALSIDELKRLKKDELISIANDDLGIGIAVDATKADIAQAIVDAR